MIDYMLKYIDDHYGKRPSLNSGERAELEYLRVEVASMRKMLTGNANHSAGVSTGESEKRGEISSEDSEGEDDIGDLPDM